MRSRKKKAGTGPALKFSLKAPDRHCEQSEAIQRRQSSTPSLDCVVAPLLAMTANLPQAAFLRGWISLRLTSTSAIWTAFSAAPLRRLSETHQKERPFSTVASSRMREI
jgi:hypothetical protein